MFRSVNPFNQSVVAEYPADDERTINKKVEASFRAFRMWKKESFARRSDLMMRAGELLLQNKEKYARIISTEMGKVLSEARSEVEKCAGVCEYFAKHAQQFLADMRIETEAVRSFVAFEPLGPVLAIMPWNFPFWQVFRFAAPALMAGNTGLLKHASNVPQSSLAIETIFLEAGFPEGVFQSLLMGSREVEGLIARDEVRAVTLTGSEYAGTQVAAAAGKNIKKTVLELGGSDPFIVLEDADLDMAAQVGVQSRMRNAGQSCIAAKRFIVLEKVKDAFLQRFIDHVKTLRQGDQLDPQTTVGPVARLDLAEDLEKQVKASIKQGAQRIWGGDRNGCNFQPSILEGVKPGMTAFDEEMFGPVAAIITVKDEQEAIEIANMSRYGLGASVWTKDIERGERIARQIESGSVFVNSLMRSDQRLPFGGVKKSGYGRELSEFGIKEFVNIKTIYIDA